MKSVFHSYNKRIATFLLLLALQGFLWIGCGQKGPPRPPRPQMPTAVHDLAFSVHDGLVELTWTVADSGGRDTSPPETVKVFRARLSDEEAGCEKCPLRYSVSGEIPVQKKQSEKSRPIRMRYAEFIEPGYHYVFKVIVYDAAGSGSQDSNIVQFDH